MTKLHASRFKSAELVRLVHDIVPEAGTPFEDILKPEYWAHVAQSLRPWARIEVRAEDGSYFAELLVVNCGRLWAKVAVLRKVDLGDMASEAVPANPDPSFSVMWRGPHAKHAVMRLGKAGGKEVLREGFETKDEAATWMADHIKALAA